MTNPTRLARRTPELVALLLLVACSASCSSQKPDKLTDADIAPKDQDPDAPVPELGPLGRGGINSGAPNGAQRPPGAPPPDSTSGPIATLIYVTEISLELHGPTKPAAIIFSSDPDSPYLGESPRPTRILKPVEPAKLARILEGLRGAGFDSLPAEKQSLNEAINPGRQIILIQNGTRVDYKKDACNQDGPLFKKFVACERLLVKYSHGADPFVATDAPTEVPGSH